MTITNLVVQLLIDSILRDTQIQKKEPEEMMLSCEAFPKHAPYMEKLSRVVPQDNKRNRFAEMMLKEGELQCLLDQRRL